ncbi:MAG: efflux RND transporter periplasmic adaptor subunit [Planctomycetes bacterium]|nr:efflux RND transporter periplasmic adaptor subunit [Planctomycetota bacterium]
MSTRLMQWIFWPTAVILVFGTTYILWRYAQPRRHSAPAHAVGKHDPDVSPDDDDDEPRHPPETTNVKFIYPRRGVMERVSVQVGSVEADEVFLQAKVSGFLKAQYVNIGHSVQEGDVLAIIDVPELEKLVERNAALVEQANARVKQMKAKLTATKADLDAAHAEINYADAFARAATAWVGYRGMVYQRMKELAASKNIEQRVEDESKQQHDAARESESAAKAAITKAKANAAAVGAKVLLADADVDEAMAQVKVAQAEHERTQEQFKFATIVAPFNGHITERRLVAGAFVRSAAEGSTPQTIFAIQRPDRMRVVVQIPDSDVPFASKDKPAIVELDAFPGVKFEAKISRVSPTEDVKTRLMHVEIDLPNKDGIIRQGMFGKVTIFLDKMTKQLSVPSSCLAGKSKARKGAVFVVRDGKAYLTKVRFGMDNGSRVEVLPGGLKEIGLKETDRVILAPPAGLADGMEVQATVYEEPELNHENVP